MTIYLEACFIINSISKRRGTSLQLSTRDNLGRTNQLLRKCHHCFVKSFSANENTDKEVTSYLSIGNQNGPICTIFISF